jgi:hypothetical protein
MPYTSKLINHCKEVLGKSDIFDDIDHIRTFFTGDLDIYKKKIPDKAKNSLQRMEFCVDYLLKLPPSEDGKPAIVIFIINLMSHYSEEESGTRKQLADLINDFSLEAENSIQRISKEKQRLERQENDDLQQAKDVLQYSENSPEIPEWFNSLDTVISEKTFKIALAVLNGARYGSVLDAAGNLQNLLSVKPKEATTSLESDPFSRGRNSRLEYSELKDITNIFGERVSTIQYKNPAYPYNILEFIWKEYDDPSFREPFINWLTNLAVDIQFDIRNRVALTVGILTQLDFPDVRDKILRKWALKNDRSYRVAIGKALGVATENETIGEEVILMLENWGNSKDGSLVWAANRAYSNVGVRYPKKAFEQWQKIFTSGDRLIDYKLTPTLHLSLVNPLHMSIVDSMLLLLLTAPDTEKYLQVYQVALHQLLAWSTSESNRSKTNLGLSLFIVCMNTFVREVNKPTTKDEDEFIESPAMIKIINPSIYSTYRQDLCQLIYLALNFEPTRLPVTEALHNWFYWVNDTVYTDNLLALMRDLFIYSANHKEAVKERFRLYLKEWGKDLALARKAFELANNKLLTTG